MGSKREDTSVPGAAGSIERRDFLKAAAVAAATGALTPAAVLAGQSPPLRAALQERQEVPLVPLGNGEHPALVFQAYPGGTGALMEKLSAQYGVDLFRRQQILVDPWMGAVPGDPADVAFLPVDRLAALIRGRHMSSVELTEIYLERLKRYDPVLLCAVTILEGRAREEAQQADADLRNGEYHGPLHGIPYGVKDLFSVTGARTTWGSSDFENRVIEEDADVVVRLRESGAVLIAKLATGEFARGDQWYRGRTRNPWNAEEGASGSSAGPGSATAAAAVAFAIGTETQGSIVSPARRNGLSALRPTFGRVSRYGGMVLSWSMDKAGPMCRTIEDCALVFNAIHGASERDPASLTTPFRFDRNADLGSFRIGYDETAQEPFLEQLRSMGANLREMNPIPSGSSNALNVESSAAFDFHVAPDGVEPEPIPEGATPQERRDRGRFRGGRAVTALDFVQSQRRRLILMREMQEAMEGFDMFVSGSGQVGLTNQTGHPAAIVQYGFGVRDPEADSPTEMPLTSTLIGDLFADDKILSVAHAFQRNTDWHLRRPRLDG
ncbi:MAG: amidase [Gemmatimonadetes bacterium]|nr:amidase [Gemmatimonadota bacterium]MDA1103110.1 amidase [Gemmatimonadota bacterium]